MFDFEIICRTCSKEGELNSLFSNENLNIGEILKEFTNLEVSEQDKLPKKICSICLNKLKLSYLFKKQCLEIHFKFIEYLNNLTIKEEQGSVDAIKVELEEQHPIEEYNYNKSCNSQYTSKLIKTDLTETHSSFKYSKANEKFLNNCSSVKINSISDKSSMRLDKSNFVEIVSKIENTLEYEKVKRKKVIKKLPRKCPYCDKTVNRLKPHLKTHTKEKPYKCELCEREFAQLSSYKRHIKIHTGEKPFLCTICGKSFLRKESLHFHIQSHTNEKPFICKYCGKSYRQNISLCFHIVNKHKASDCKEVKIQPKRKCEVCNKMISYHSFKTHIETHNEKKFLCAECGKRFCTKYSLEQHHSTHTGDKPYKCKFCTKSFTHFSSRQSHESIHTGEKRYKCSLCPKAFIRLDKLKCHSRVHSGEKPYKCSICHKQFTLSGNLAVHMRIHTGERPHVCNICNKGFYASNSLKKHKQTHILKNVNNINCLEESE